MTNGQILGLKPHKIKVEHLKHQADNEHSRPGCSETENKTKTSGGLM